MFLELLILKSLKPVLRDEKAKNFWRYWKYKRQVDQMWSSCGGIWIICTKGRVINMVKMYFTTADKQAVSKTLNTQQSWGELHVTMVSRKLLEPSNWLHGIQMPRHPDYRCLPQKTNWLHQQTLHYIDHGCDLELTNSELIVKFTGIVWWYHHHHYHHLHHHHQQHR